MSKASWKALLKWASRDKEKDTMFDLFMPNASAALKAKRETTSESSQIPDGVYKSKIHFEDSPKVSAPRNITILSDEDKADELLTVILEKFKDYKTNCTVENDLINKLITELQRSRFDKRNELDVKENELCDGMNELDAIMKAHMTHIMY